MQVLTIGNAITDILAQVDDQFLHDRGCTKGAMTLIESHAVNDLYDAMPASVNQSGGSAANTAAGIAALGGKAGFTGKVASDQFGSLFSHDIRAQGVDFTTEPLVGGDPTACCLVLVTPDGQRTMQTYLGACGALGPDDIDDKQVCSADITYIEGYLWDRDNAKKAVSKAIDLAKDAGKEVALSLSDSFCVDRYRNEFLNLVRRDVDIVFANEDEIKSLYQVATFDEALQHAQRDVKLACLTRGEKGCVIISGDHIHIIDAVEANVVDTTGAGDMFAAGFLYGYTHRYSLADCGRIGCILAGHITEHIGARPQGNMQALIEERLPKPLKELGGRSGPEPTRFGDWEKKGLISDF